MTAHHKLERSSGLYQNKKHIPAKSSLKDCPSVISVRLLN